MLCFTRGLLASGDLWMVRRGASRCATPAAIVAKDHYIRWFHSSAYCVDSSIGFRVIMRHA